MTIDDPVQYSSLILPSSPTFYHAKIPDKHWQLRSLLCSPESDILYYPTGKNIYLLNTKSRRREFVASLPFNPRCIGARYGWACAGGKDNGHFASIRIGRYGKPRPCHEDESVGMEVDAEEESMLRPEVNISELTGSIVNSITLHRPQGSQNDDDVLAILTNNDKTVRVFSLAQNCVQATLHLPISTNHASMSPDGKHLVVVGDSTKVYFYHSNPGTSLNCETGREPWTLTCQLPAGVYDALISTAFCPSSVLCAVASQEGTITIFDIRHLSRSLSPDCPSPIVKQILSTRPKTYAGAVRSIQFSPAPLDLLVWAEHSGRVTIADTRSNFSKRQVIDVLNNSEKIVDVDVVGASDDDPPSECREEHRRRSLTREEDDDEEDATTEEIEGYFRAHFMGRDGWMANPTVSTTPLNPVSIGSTASPGYMHPRYFMRNIPSAAVSPYTLNPSAGTPHITISTSDNSSINAIGFRPASPTTPNPLHDYRERQLEHDPSTVVADNNNTGPNRPVHWRIDYEAQRRPAEEVDQLQRNREQLSLMIAEERRRNILRRTNNTTGVNRRNGFNGASVQSDHEPSEIRTCEDVDITGCTMSVDGSKLYIATDKGIVEYKIDIAGRRVFPSLQCR
ncbi:WD40-repeat-containing domain protein [Terfezia claveryi]|nr:WD40-repeat-containing domain protein [Terfezia claveryi]